MTLRGGPGGVADLRGNLIDGETGGTLAWPHVPGDGTAGGDFVTTFTIGQARHAAGYGLLVESPAGLLQHRPTRRALHRPDRWR